MCLIAIYGSSLMLIYLHANWAIAIQCIAVWLYINIYNFVFIPTASIYYHVIYLHILQVW